MAARKSCTHLTWGEAKGGGAPGGKVKKSKGKVSHKQLILDRAVNGKFTQKKKAWTNGEIQAHKDRAAAAAAKAEREAKEAEQAARRAREEEARAKEEKGSQCAALAMQSLAEALQTVHNNNNNNNAEEEASPLSLSELEELLECRQQQLDEFTALHAILEQEFRAFAPFDSPEAVEAEQEALSALEDEVGTQAEDAAVAALSAAVCNKPPLGCTLQLSIEGGPDKQQPLTAMALLRLSFPPGYPTLGGAPAVTVERLLVVDKSQAEPTAFEAGKMEELQAAIVQEAGEILPGPCGHELTQWLEDHLWDYW